MEFDCKLYLLRNGILEQMIITREMLEEWNVPFTEEQINCFLKKNQQHYLLLEFYCDKLGLPHRGEEDFLSPTTYSEYLNGILCDEGYVTFAVINNELNNNISFSTKAKNRYNRTSKTILVHVPHDLSVIDNRDIDYLNMSYDDLK